MKRIAHFFLLLVLLTSVFTFSPPLGDSRIVAGSQYQESDRTPTFNSARIGPSAITGSVSATDLAVAMDINPADIVSASLNGSDPRGVGVGNSPISTFFPMNGSSFTALSTGRADQADLPNDSDSTSTILNGLNNADGTDMTQLAITLHVPSNANCASFDFAFYSEEFPEFVGSEYNDIFTAEVPNNIAFDTGGNIISINTLYNVSSSTGNTYDGGTTLLRAWTPVTPSSNKTIVFSIQDISDSVYDSTVFMDNFRWSNTTQCYSGATNYTTFTDVLTVYWAWAWIDKLYNSGITGGCIPNPLQYCPDSNVTRAQMAVFLLKGIHGSSYTPPNATGTKFSDVPAGYWAAAWIEQLAAEGITGGCGNGNYCPDDIVTRAQMAIFMLRAKHGPSYVPPSATGNSFTDVPASYWAAAWIEQLAVEAITSGCGSGIYCPDNPITRAQMAVFLVRLFNLP